MRRSSEEGAETTVIGSAEAGQLMGSSGSCWFDQLDLPLDLPDLP